MMSAGVLRLVLVLSTFCLAVYALLDRSIIDRAELNAWIELQDEDQSALKVVKADKVTYRTKLSYKKGEDYCEKEDAHLTSIRSQDEEHFIAELVLALHKRNGGEKDSSVTIPTGYSAEWSDRSDSEYLLEKHYQESKKCVVMQPEGITKAFESYVKVVPCDDLPVNNQLYVVCRQ